MLVQWLKGRNIGIEDLGEKKNALLGTKLGYSLVSHHPGGVLVQWLKGRNIGIEDLGEKKKKRISPACSVKVVC